MKSGLVLLWFDIRLLNRFFQLGDSKSLLGKWLAFGVQDFISFFLTNSCLLDFLPTCLLGWGPTHVFPEVFSLDVEVVQKDHKGWMLGCEKKHTETRLSPRGSFSKGDQLINSSKKLSRHPGDDGVPKFFSSGKGGKVHHVSTGGLAPIWDKNYGFFILVLYIMYTSHILIYEYIKPQKPLAKQQQIRSLSSGDSAGFLKRQQMYAALAIPRTQHRILQILSRCRTVSSPKYISFDLSWRSLTSALKSTYCFQAFLTLPRFSMIQFDQYFSTG